MVASARELWVKAYSPRVTLGTNSAKWSWTQQKATSKDPKDPTGFVYIFYAMKSLQ